MKSEDIIHLYHQGIISSLDLHFAEFIIRLSVDGLPELFLAAALVSKFTGEGHICLDLSSLAGKPLLTGDSGCEPIICPELSLWHKILVKTSVVGKPGDYKPLILDSKSRLYLYRYWEYEKKLAEIIRKRMNIKVADIDFHVLAEGLGRLFPKNQDEVIDWQKVAAINSVFNRFSVISGGPGTGKTTTVVKILVLLLEQAKGQNLRIALAAPTGKAAARLQEAIKKTKRELNSSENIKEAIPEEASTIHRLLGSIIGSPYFHYNSEHQLSVDVVVVDEVSMVPLSLMAKLIEAIPLEARMILLGDKDQLASVEPGAVLGDICDTGKIHNFPRTTLQMLKAINQQAIDIKPKERDKPRIKDCIVELQKSFRFEKGSGIGEISLAINDGDSNGALQLMKSGKYSTILWKALPIPKAIPWFLKNKVISGFKEYLKIRDPEKALSFFEQFRIICALREGPYGVSSLNLLVEQILKKQNLIEPEQRWYAGRPIMITRNDYNLKLFNGDVGIILPDPEVHNELRAFFPAADGGLKKFPLLRLPEHETVFATTVHKSQGSEFEGVLFILPDSQSPVLTRELIYTGITRAKKRVEIWGLEEVFHTAVSSRIERTSGLRDALWEE